ncbi:protein-disulfide reductase DsbD [Paludibacterium yongneupense]|uniref:protein-disulfide reductase DsbD n=1 Tax=Paludibacterium yongneupense TaxID=400061 RepID=UPI000422BFEB|nr:protein-disulfide reductase DsbD [Paludibacterium yongneupense]
MDQALLGRTIHNNRSQPVLIHENLRDEPLTGQNDINPMPRIATTSFKRIFTTLWLILGLYPIFTHALDPNDLLAPEKAFAASYSRQAGEVVILLDVAPGYYVYRDRIRLSSTPDHLLRTPDIPPGKIKHDPYFGKQAILTGENRIRVPLSPAAPPRFQLQFKLQGCAEAGVCYPPYTHHLAIGSRPGDGWLRSAADTRPAPPPAPPSVPVSRLTALAGFFLAGLGMAATACLYPLLPIVSSLIAGQGAALTRARGFLLALAYVQGLALSYTVVGVVAGSTGSLLTVWLQQAPIVLAASLLMIVLGLSMFDIVTLQLPAALQSRLAARTNRLSGGRLATVFAMGALSALIIGPCVAPPLVVALAYIGSLGSPGFGAAALYSMAMGIGLPLLLIGGFGGHILPRAGNWMNTVKAVFGFVMFGLAIRLAAPFMPYWAVTLAWATLLIAAAVTLYRRHGRGPRPLIARALALILLLAAAGAVGVQWRTQTLAARAVQAFTPVRSSAELDRAVAAARGRPVLLDIYADWCVACKEMEAETFPDPAVASRLAAFVLLRADVTANDPAARDLLRRFGLYGPPAIILFDRNGREADRVIGFMPAAPFQDHLSALR